MNKSYLAVGLLVAAILVVGIALTRPDISNTGAAVETATANKSIVVTYSDKGFAPSVAKVPRGASVTFLNMSSKALRIAPLQEPKDDTSAYLGFQSSRAIGRGESFGASLSQSGLWGYKNLHDPTSVGVVIVE